jgi:hypothetical protein
MTKQDTAKTAAATCPASESVSVLAVTGFETASLSRAGPLVLWQIKRLGQI